MTQATDAASVGVWDSFLATINELRTKNCERHAIMNKKLDDIRKLMATFRRLLGLHVEDEASMESGVYDNDEDEIGEYD